LLLSAALLGTPVPGLAEAETQPKADTSPVAEAQVLRDVACKTPIPWYLQTDIGLLHVYCDGRLRTFDLLDAGKPVGEPLDLPGAEEQGSVIHLPGTGLLLVTRVANPSFLMNILTGETLWTAASLPIARGVLVFPHSGVVVLRSGMWSGHLTAVDLRSGRVLWREDVQGMAPPIRPVGDYLLAPDMVGAHLIDVKTGHAVWTVQLPVNLNGWMKTVLLLPGNRLLYHSRKHLEMFEVPPVQAGDSPEAAPVAGNLEARSLWAVRLKDVMTSLRLASPSRILLSSGTGTYEMVDADAGRHMWKKDLVAGQAINAPGLTPAPKGSYGVVYLGYALHVIDLETGRQTAAYDLPTQDTSSGKGHVEWLTDDELLVISTDGQALRFNVPEHRAVWARRMPEPINLELTARQRGLGTVVFVAAVAMVAATVALAAATPAMYAPVVAPAATAAEPLAAGVMLVGAAAVAGTAAGAAMPPVSGTPRRQISEDPAAGSPLARARRDEIVRRYGDLVGKERILLTGGNDTYSVVALHEDDGEFVTLASYEAPRVHLISPEVPFGVMVSLEENRRVLRILSMPAAGAAAVDPSLLVGPADEKR
jgi:outer membrane protein assembly factor BamB